MALEAGMPSLILPEFDAGEILRLAGRGAFTKTFLVPAALRQLVDHPRAAVTDFSSVRMILYGASPMALIGCDFA